MDTTKLHPIEKIAADLGRSPFTVRGWVKRKLLKKTKVGGKVYISEQDLEDFIRRCNDGSPPSAGAVNTAVPLAATA